MVNPVMFSTILSIYVNLYGSSIHISSQTYNYLRWIDKDRNICFIIIFITLSFVCLVIPQIKVYLFLLLLPISINNRAAVPTYFTLYTHSICDAYKIHLFICETNNLHFC